jgi:putative ABC transport system substrate-binding protein
VTKLSRRQFVQRAGVTSLGLLAGCGRLPGQAQAPTKVPRVGWLTGVSAAAGQADIFRQALRELGWVDQENIVLEFRYADGQIERLPELAADLVQQRVDLIVATGEPYILAAQAASDAVPIVMATSADPVGNGLVASLAHPGGNVTGLSLLSQDLSRKRLDLLVQAVPGMSRVAALTDPANAVAALEWQETQSAAQTLGLHVQAVEARSGADLQRAIDAASAAPADALVVFSYAVALNNRQQIVDLATAAGLPTMYGRKDFVDVGGLMAYGPNLPSMYRRSATYVDRILRGTKPADLPIEQPTTFDFVINLQTAQALGLTIPQHVLLQATEVIQ